MRVLLVDPGADLLASIQPAVFSMPELEMYCAPDGTTAVEHARLLGGVDVLITEIFLSGTDGLTIQTALQQTNPSLITVFLTRHDLGAYSTAVGETPVFEIPVDPESFAQAFRRYLRKQKAALAVPPPKAPSVQPAAPSERPPAVTEPEPFQAIQPAHPAPAKNQARPPVNAAAEAQAQPVFPEAPSLPRNEAPPPAPPKQTSPPAATHQTVSTPPPWQNETAEAPFHLAAGSRFGPYQILREDGEHPFGKQFAAVHLTLNRPVHLVVMDEESARHAELRDAVLLDARAKAKVQHPALLAVYEAGELEGHIFCAAERIDSNSLEHLLEKRSALQADTLLAAAKTVAEAMLYLRNSNIPHLPLTTEDILISVDGSVRIQNIALGGLHPASDESVDLALLGESLLSVMPEEAPQPLRSLLERTLPSHPKKLERWDPFLVALAASQFSEASPRDRNPHTRPSSFKNKLWGILTLLVLFGALGAGVFYIAAPEPLVPRQAVVPAGQFLLSNNKRISLQSFSIDSTEVTNRQYFQFVDWIRKHPKEATRFDHPEQPANHSHIPPGWAEMFPEKTTPRKSPQNPQWDLPVVKVTWWDAFSFAAWAGRELPSDEEWEAAGRGPRGLLFPWGDEPDPERTNVALPEFRIQKGETNAPVSVQSMHDSSTFGVTGLSGNVSEWTATRKDGKALVKGGHFNAPLLTLDASSSLALDTRSPQVGFRTLSRKTNERP